MVEHEKERTAETIKHLAAEFIKEVANPSPLITATNIRWIPKAKKAVVFFTAYPEEKESEALAFLKRKRTEFKNYVKDNSRVGIVPSFDFEIDKGEKNRQRIEKLSNKE